MKNKKTNMTINKIDSSKSISVAALTKRNIQELLILGIKDIK